MLNTYAIIRIYLILIAVRPGIRNGKQKNVLPNNFFVTIWKRLFSVKSFSFWSREWLTLYPLAIILLEKP